MRPASSRLILVTGPGLLRPSYCNYLTWLGPHSMLITPGAAIPEEFSGLVLSGGGDVHADRYGGDAALCEMLDPTRDDFEFELLRTAFARKVPVLGICRGVQVLNVFLGGTLVEHMEGHSALIQGDRNLDRRHPIAVSPGTRLHAILGAESLEVNSAHHQAIRELGRGLVVSATANDGTIEAVELPGEHFVLGVQWHPERDRDENGDYSPSSVKLRGAFLSAVDLACP